MVNPKEFYQEDWEKRLRRIKIPVYGVEKRLEEIIGEEIIEIITKIKEKIKTLK